MLNYRPIKLENLKTAVKTKPNGRMSFRPMRSGMASFGGVITLQLFDSDVFIGLTRAHLVNWLKFYGSFKILRFFLVLIWPF